MTAPVVKLLTQPDCVLCEHAKTVLDGAPFTFGRLSERALRRALNHRILTAHDRK